MGPCKDHGQVGGPQGYHLTRVGAAQFGVTKVLLHRKVFYQTYGHLPEVVQHKCDNPRCVNPDHLEAGTWASNNQDRARKGRSAKVRKDLRKLTYADAENIREELKRGTTIRALATRYGVDGKSITNVRDGRTFFAGV